MNNVPKPGGYILITSFMKLSSFSISWSAFSVNTPSWRARVVWISSRSIGMNLSGSAAMV